MRERERCPYPYQYLCNSEQVLVFLWSFWTRFHGYSLISYEFCMVGAVGPIIFQKICQVLIAIGCHVPAIEKYFYFKCNSMEYGHEKPLAFTLICCNEVSAVRSPFLYGLFFAIISSKQEKRTKSAIFYHSFHQKKCSFYQICMVAL